MYRAEFEGITFVEGRPAECHIIRQINTQIDGFLTSAQMKSLDDIKRLMVAECRKEGGNAIVDFKYTQKSRNFLASLFSRDDMLWEASGAIAILDKSS